MGLNELIEVINEGGEIRDAVSEAIGEYSTDDPNQIFDVIASNIARTSSMTSRYLEAWFRIWIFRRRKLKK